MQKYLTAFLLSIVFMVSCSGGGTTIVNNPTGSAITLGQLTSDGRSSVTIPLDVFGDSASDLSGALIDISVNNGETVYTDLDPEDYYDSVEQVISFILANLADGDEIEFTITKNDNTQVVFTGTISRAADSEATSSSDTETTDSPVSRLTDAVCDKLSACHASLSFSTCETGVLADDQILDEFGGPSTDGDGIPFSDFEDSLDNGSYTTDTGNLESCEAAIAATLCSDEGIQASWDSSDPTNFQNVENMILSSACGDVFQATP